MDVTALLQTLEGQDVILSFETRAYHFYETTWIDNVSLSTDAPSNTAPVASCQDVIEECTGNSQAAASIDNGSSDPDGDDITTEENPGGPYSLGETLVTLEVDDGLDTDSCQATVTVEDTTDPVLTAPANPASAECAGALTAVALNQGSATDSCQAVTVTDDRPAAGYPMGDTTVTFTATDGSNSVSATTTVSVVDTTPPNAPECNAPSTIKPPDAPVSFTATSSDICSAVTTEITGYSCLWQNPSGKTVTRGCEVVLSGATITINDSGGVHDVISWTVTATDGSGNTSDSICTTTVVNPGKGNPQGPKVASANGNNGVRDLGKGEGNGKGKGKGK